MRWLIAAVLVCSGCSMYDYGQWYQKPGATAAERDAAYEQCRSSDKARAKALVGASLGGIAGAYVATRGEDSFDPVRERRCMEALGYEFHPVMR